MERGLPRVDVTNGDSTFATFADVSKVDLHGNYSPPVSGKSGFIENTVFRNCIFGLNVISLQQDPLATELDTCDKARSAFP